MRTSSVFAPRKTLVQPGLLPWAVVGVAAFVASSAPTWAQIMVGMVAVSAAPATTLIGRWLFRGARVEVTADELRLVGRRRFSMRRSRVTVSTNPPWVESPVLAGMLRPWIERLTGRLMQFGFPVQLGLHGVDVYVIFDDAAEAERLVDALRTPEGPSSSAC